MKKLFSLGVSALLILSVKGQGTDSAYVSARYSFTHVMDTTQPDNPLKENMILYLGKNMSNYTNYDRIESAAKAKAAMQSNGGMADMKDVDITNIKSMSISNGVATVTSNTGAVMSFVPPPSMVNSYLKDQAGSTLAYIASGGGKLYAVEEKIPTIEWNITQETKTIQGLPCQKATCNFKGRSYEAWFCSQLPYNNGPWKLGGLPGLILEASDSKKEVVFSFTSFENLNDSPVVIALPANIIKTTPKEFKKYQEAIEKDRQARMGNNGVGVSGGQISLSSDRNSSPTKIRRMNNPIEKSND